MQPVQGLREVAMAVKASAKKSAKKSAPKNTGGSAKDRVIDAVAAEAAAVGWRNVSMEAVAERRG